MFLGGRGRGGWIECSRGEEDGVIWVGDIAVRGELGG